MSKVIQVRDVPDAVHRRLKTLAAAEGRTLSDLVRTELARAAERPTLDEMLERIKSRAPVSLPETSADAIRSGRDRQ